MVIASRKIGYDEVEHRDLNFGMSPETVPRHWFNNDPWITHWMNAILAAVPDGERWVMQATSKQLENLHDPSVRKAAISFIRQERSHAREHDATEEGQVADVDGDALLLESVPDSSRKLARHLVLPSLVVGGRPPFAGGLRLQGNSLQVAVKAEIEVKAALLAVGDDIQSRP